jgi:phenylpropionate dioxygenase-like ring-hydroxylating dioxygenase large terminal subunit
MTDGLIAEIETAQRESITLSPRWYIDDDIFRLEMRAVFGHNWQYACHVDQVAKPGDLVPVRCGDVPIVLARDQAGELRAFVNVCRHRGHEVVLKPCNRMSVQCHYHGWTFGLDGELRAAPRERREEDFDRSQFPLFKAQVGTWGSFVFVNPDPSAADLETTTNSLSRTAERNGLDLSDMILRDSREYEVRCNWKLAVDNMIECYHCPTGHPGFNAFYDIAPENYIIELHGACSYQRGNLRDKPAAQAHKGDWGDFELYYVWPNTIMIPGPVSCIVMPMVPLAPDRTVFNPMTYFRAGVDEATVASYIEYYDEIWREDVELVESVQRGQKSQRLPWGPFFRDSERLLQQVQGLLLESLRRGPQDARSDAPLPVAG